MESVCRACLPIRNDFSERNTFANVYGIKLPVWITSPICMQGKWCYILALCQGRRLCTSFTFMSLISWSAPADTSCHSWKRYQEDFFSFHGGACSAFSGDLEKTLLFLSSDLACWSLQWNPFGGDSLWHSGEIICYSSKNRTVKLKGRTAKSCCVTISTQTLQSEQRREEKGNETKWGKMRMITNE